MFMNVKLYFIVIICFFVIFCSNENQSIQIIENKETVYRNKDLVSLKEIYSIKLVSEQYEISFVSSMEADGNDNLYILSQKEGSIYEFDESGTFNKRLGKHGHGNQDLYRAHLFTLFDNKFYIIEGFKNLKIWNKQGDFVENKKLPRSNYIKFMQNDSVFFIVDFKSSDGNKLWEYYLSTSSEDFQDFRNILRFNVDIFSNIHYSIHNSLEINKNNQFYLPGSRDNFLITKYDQKGRPILTFKRDYLRIPFSNKAETFYKEKYGEYIIAGEVSEIPQYPPIVRKTYIDSRENLWVLSGELNEDSNSDNFYSDVDIFNEDGKWLHSFKSNIFSTKSFIKNNRLYTLTKKSPFNSQQFVKVYEITYNK